MKERKNRTTAFFNLFFCLFIFIGKVSSQENKITDLELEMSIDNAEAAVGSSVVFRVTVHNKGPLQATGVIVKNKLPAGYSVVKTSTDTSNYNDTTGLWKIGILPVDKSELLIIHAIVNTTGDYMNLAEVITCDQVDLDSYWANGVDTDKDGLVVDDPDDEDDGDGQDIKLKDEQADANVKPSGIKADMTDLKGNAATYLFDINTLAMRVELDKNKKQPDMFFDKAGYVYTASKKQDYVKIPFEKLKKLRMFPAVVSGGVLPPLDIPDGSIKYYGMDVSPKKYPILEWAFVYKTKHFDGKPEFKKEITACRENAGCIKYTLISGPEAGSYVLFDSATRLAEIFSTHSGKVVYTYLEISVVLPKAKEMPFMTDMF